MRRSRFSEEQIIGILKELEAGMPTVEVSVAPAPAEPARYPAWFNAAYDRLIAISTAGGEGVERAREIVASHFREHLNANIPDKNVKQPCALYQSSRAAYQPVSSIRWFALTSARLTTSGSTLRSGIALPVLMTIPASSSAPISNAISIPSALARSGTWTASTSRPSSERPSFAAIRLTRT